MSRPLAVPRPVRIRAGEGGRPAALEDVPVEAVREEWVVEDRWWTDTPLRRHYFEVVLADGRCAVVFRDVVRRRWASQVG